MRRQIARRIHERDVRKRLREITNQPSVTASPRGPIRPPLSGRSRARGSAALDSLQRFSGVMEKAFDNIQLTPRRRCRIERLGRAAERRQTRIDRSLFDTRDFDDLIDDVSRRRERLPQPLGRSPVGSNARSRPRETDGFIHTVRTRWDRSERRATREHRRPRRRPRASRMPPPQTSARPAARSHTAGSRQIASDTRRPPTRR